MPWVTGCKTWCCCQEYQKFAEYPWLVAKLGVTVQPQPRLPRWSQGARPCKDKDAPPNPPCEQMGTWQWRRAYMSWDLGGCWTDFFPQVCIRLFFIPPHAHDTPRGSPEKITIERKQWENPHTTFSELWGCDANYSSEQCPQNLFPYFLAIFQKKNQLKVHPGTPHGIPLLGAGSAWTPHLPSGMGTAVKKEVRLFLEETRGGVHWLAVLLDTEKDGLARPPYTPPGGVRVPTGKKNSYGAVFRGWKR